MSWEIPRPFQVWKWFGRMMNIEYRETRWISVQSGPRSFMLQARLRISCKVILF